MKIKKFVAPVLFEAVGGGDLFYFSDGRNPPLLAMRVEEAQTEHPFMILLEGEKPFRQENAEHYLDKLVQPATDLECEIIGSFITVSGSIQDLPDGSLIYRDGRTAIIAKKGHAKSAYDLETGKELKAMGADPFGHLKSWKLVRRVELPLDHEFKNIHTFPLKGG
ncbi:hypothetical protein [Bradyrhizobium lablabi]|uniref:hypothetical protein n=1 Tax=Bradyrhizobium lablabi TaxID=722472 RepID=UPI00090CA186|nr:hypothetical protein [Bradyrhizobium lablabi]SHM37693.1 hypothetical protein SAMN05444321_6146 [Bradyrhizobium lablabi]